MEREPDFRSGNTGIVATKVSVFYPYEEGKSFDMDYCCSKHISKSAKKKFNRVGSPPSLVPGPVGSLLSACDSPQKKSPPSGWEGRLFYR